MAKSRPVARKKRASKSQAGPVAARKLAAGVLTRLAKHFGPVATPLTYAEPHELCIAVILSAQCTDAQVNKVTPELFRRFPNPEDYATASLTEIERLIYSTGFYKNKARSIQGFCRALLADHDGKVPRDPDLLRKLPGVGRKTANVIQQELFGVATGVVVDTHVARISQKVLKLTTHSDPAKIERDLMAVVVPARWRDWSLYLIFLGRFCCTARRRDCGICPLRAICPSSTVPGKG